MNTDVTSTLKTLRLTRKAFANVEGRLSRHKRETLALAFEQIKPTLKAYMDESNVLQLEVNLKDRTAFALEPICNNERNLWIRLWLRGECSTRKLRERMKLRFQWVQYLSFNDFLEGVEHWLKEECGEVQYD